jgi:hypothetical protein
MTEYRKGIENIPLFKVNNHCPIYVIVRNLRSANEEDDVVAEYRWDMSDPLIRKQLGKLTFWCTENHHSVETMSINDVEG